MNALNNPLFEKQLQNFIVQTSTKSASIGRAPQGHWDVRDNQRKFFDSIGKTLGIIKPKDWGSISSLKVNELGGGTILKKYHGNSLIRALKYVYPG